MNYNKFSEKSKELFKEFLLSLTYNDTFEEMDLKEKDSSKQIQTNFHFEFPHFLIENQNDFDYRGECKYLPQTGFVDTYIKNLFIKSIQDFIPVLEDVIKFKKEYIEYDYFHNINFLENPKKVERVYTPASLKGFESIYIQMPSSIHFMSKIVCIKYKKCVVSLEVVIELYDNIYSEDSLETFETFEIAYVKDLISFEINWLGVQLNSHPKDLNIGYLLFMIESAYKRFNKK